MSSITDNKQIVYLWINRDSKGCFDDSEFNFNPKYRIHFEKSSRELTIVKTEDINVFERYNVANLTAVIGNNGVGKTTLFNKLFNLPAYNIKKIIYNEDKRYLRYVEERRNENYYIAVFLVGQCLHAVNNYDGPINYGGETININVGMNTDAGDVFNDLTKVFFSFSSHGKDASSSFIEENRNEFYLHPSNIVREGMAFFSGFFSSLAQTEDYEAIKTYCGQSFSFENLLIAFALCNDPILTKRENIKFNIFNLFGKIINSEAGSNEDFKRYIINLR